MQPWVPHRATEPAVSEATETPPADDDSPSPLTAAMEVARLYAATAGHPLDDEPPQQKSKQPRLRLSRISALVGVIAVLTIGAGVAVGTLLPGHDLRPVAAAAAAVAEPTSEPASTTEPLPVADVGLPATPAPTASAVAVASKAEPVEPTQALDPTEPIYVHVVGQVAKPGVVTLARGSRAADAIAAAGGATETADLAAINLARIVSDGEQLRVPAPGEELPPVSDLITAMTDALVSDPGLAAAGLDPLAPGSSQPPSGRTADGKVNLNTADALTLQTLPGIGPTLSQRIIDYRTANGPFSAIDQLTEVTGIGSTTLLNLRDQIAVE